MVRLGRSTRNPPRQKISHQKVAALDEYVRSGGVKEMMEGMMHKLFVSQPDDPRAFMTDYLQQAPAFAVTASPPSIRSSPLGAIPKGKGSDMDAELIRLINTKCEEGHMLTAAEMAHMKRVSRRHDIVTAIERGHLVAPEELRELRTLSLPISTRRHELEQELQNGHLLSADELQEFRLYCDAFGQGSGGGAAAAPAPPKSPVEQELEQTKLICSFVAQEMSKMGLSRALKEVMEEANRAFEGEMEPDMLRKVTGAFAQ